MDCGIDKSFARRLKYQQKRNNAVLLSESTKDDLENSGMENQTPNNLISPKKPSLEMSFTESPMKNRFYDRFIPSRQSKTWQTRFSLPDNENAEKTESDLPDRTKFYTSLLRNEILDENIGSIKSSDPKECKNLFNFSPAKDTMKNQQAYSLSPLGSYSHSLLDSPKREVKKISKTPYKVLDAPDIQDDFYLNLVDWSSTNTLGVGLGHSVYLWSATTSQVTRLCELSAEHNTVTSVKWHAKGNRIAVGTFDGSVLVYDVAAMKQTAKLQGHCARVGSLAWNDDYLCSGSRDRSIIQRDLRAGGDASIALTFQGHKQEVCGLEWSPEGQLLASGGNDNNLVIWNARSTSPMYIFQEHKAAVKAVSWSPHHHGLLATGGGTADRKIRFWNTISGQQIQAIETGSQVCNLAWSRHGPQLVSTHGYSGNQIILWNYPSMSQVAILTGHSYRVLYLAVSPDGESIVTGAGDETLRFWNVFPKTTARPSPQSLLTLYTNIR